MSEVVSKIGSALDEMFSPQMATTEGFALSMNQVDDAARNRTTMLSEALDDAPLGGGAAEARLYRGRALGGVDENYIADPRLVLDMPFVGKGAKNANSEGWLRDAAHYWDEILGRHPEAFSQHNRSILAGEIDGVTSPVNDATFRNVFKQYDVRGLRGKTLVHHHIGGGGQAFAIPSPLHRGFGGVHNAEKQLGIWGGDGVISNVLEKLLNGK